MNISDIILLDRPPVYADHQYFAISPMEHYPEMMEGLRMGFLLMLYCMEGDLQVRLDDNNYTLAAGDCLICPPHSMLSITHHKDSLTTLVGFSMEAVTRMLTGGDRVWRVLSALIQKTLINNEPRYLHARIATFLNTLRYRTRSNDLYIDEVIYHHFASLFFDVVNDLHVPAPSAVTSQDIGRHQRTQFIYNRFLALLNEDEGRNRSVQYFAEKLFITPKYLSKITKTYTQRPALDLIIEYAANRIKTELRYTDRPMKDIADHFRFENYPNFCKFVKQYIGTTPQEYRRRQDETYNSRANIF